MTIENLKHQIEDLTLELEAVSKRLRETEKRNAELHAAPLAEFFCRNEMYINRVVYLMKNDQMPRACLYIKSHSPAYIPLRTLRYMAEYILKTYGEGR